VLAVLLLSSGAARLAAGDVDSQKIPSSLEEMISTALRSNPEVLFAQAKVRQSEAELNETRLRVTREVARIHGQREQQERVMTTLRKEHDRIREMFKNGVISDSEVAKITIELAEAGARLSEIEADARYLLGLGGSVAPEPIDIELGAPDAIGMALRPEIPEPFRELLEKRVDVDFEEATLPDVLAQLASLVDNRISFITANNPGYAMLMINFKLARGTTLGSVLLALADRYQLCFVFRDYGLLVTDPHQAKYLNGATIPPDIPLAPPK